MEELNKMLYYQKKYGKRRNDSWNDWILRKRSINIGTMVVSAVEGLDFSDFELALYFRCDDPMARKFVRAFEGQMEEAAIHPEKFVENLDGFYRKTCIYIEENRLFREFYEFCELLTTQRRLKISQGHKKIFDAYMSLLMQQAGYFCRNRPKDNVVGVKDSGDLIFLENPDPYCDLPSYELEKRNYLKLIRQPKLDETVRKTYRMYGYDVSRMDDIELIEARAKVYDNNIFVMAPYINERNQDMLPKVPYGHGKPEFPRKWKETEFYKEKLMHRSCLLPANGITASYVNAGDFDIIHFSETMYREEIVLLYRIHTRNNGEHSGYYGTKSRIFYSIYEGSPQAEWHRNVENFILENYMILTCPYEIDRKRNQAIKQTENLKRDFHYPCQPLVSYTYKGEIVKSSKKGGRTYIRGEYQEEMANRNGYVRNLPDGQCASTDAVRRASELGLELPPGKTYVRSHEFKVYRKAFLQGKMEGENANTNTM